MDEESGEWVDTNNKYGETVQRNHSRVQELWKSFLCAVFDLRVYCGSLVRGRIRDLG